MQDIDVSCSNLQVAGVYSVLGLPALVVLCELRWAILYHLHGLRYFVLMGSLVIILVCTGSKATSSQLKILLKSLTTSLKHSSRHQGLIALTQAAMEAAEHETALRWEAMTKHERHFKFLTEEGGSPKMNEIGKSRSIWPSIKASESECCLFVRI